jgi:neutral ceramidase
MSRMLRLAIALATICCAACASAPANPGSSGTGLMPVGVAEIDITPDEAIRLTGYGNRSEPTAEVRQRLHATAMAFGGAQPSVLITADLIGVPLSLTDEVARRLSGSGVSRAQLAIAVTHTHTGPSLAGVLPRIFSVPATPAQEAVIAAYTRVLTDKFERVAREALKNRQPAKVGWALGRASFAANRRVLKDGKWAAFGVTAGGAVDHDLPVLAVHSPRGELRAVLASYACHATTLEARDNFIHGDWPGTAKALIAGRHPGAIAMVSIGTGADSNPFPRGGGLPDVERHAATVAAEVDRLLRTELRPLPSAPAGRFMQIDVTFAGDPTVRPYPVQTWTFGNDLAMVFLGGEVVADYGLRLKRELDASRFWVNAYSNDVSFYVASRRMIPEGGYEVDRSMDYYGQPGRLADGTEDLIVRSVHSLLPQGFRKREP